MLALVPLGSILDFNVPDSCLLYNLQSQKYAGWEYKLYVLTLMNIITILIIIVAYLKIILKVLFSQRRLSTFGNVSSAGNKTMATSISVVLLVGTNLITWIPILSLSIMVAFSFQIPSEVSR